MINSIISSIGSIDECKKIAQYRDKDREMILNAHKIVKSFISERKLIIFGGLAIDYALRLKGSSIYNDDDLPDYDCISPKNVDDAYDLGEILYKIGFDNVKVIRAKHVETMRVRIDLITVADISYCPVKYFNQYKYLLYDQLHITHPNIQRMDLHKAFCFPLANAPMEDIFHRWEKDLKRFNLYEEYYPIQFDTQPSYTYKDITYKLPDINFAFHGFAAFALYRSELLKYIDIDTIPNITIQFNKQTCIVNIPVTDITLDLVTDETLTKPYYESLLGLPQSKIIDNVRIYHVNMLSITKIDTKKVVTIQYLLMWLLFQYNFNDNINDRDIYGLFYKYTLQMINMSKNINNNNVKNKINVFNPSLTYIGQEEQYKPYIQDPSLPINYTPSKTDTRHTFDYNNFTISGQLCN